MKIGRNEPCPCGSGKKFKKCCKDPAKFQANRQESKVTLTAKVEALQEKAAKKENSVTTMGVFIFVATETGDGWLFEMSDLDALQVSESGEALAVEIEENPQTISVNWSHRFAIRRKKLFVTSYKDKEEKELSHLPSHSIFAAIKRMRKKFPKELLAAIHLDDD
ncbi:MAG: SEC-C metal-binding domain-containing protein [Thermodesulfobacteriota bacterium]